MVATIGVIGLGYVGLPTAIGFLEAGFNVWGVDVSENTISKLMSGKNPTGEIANNNIIPKLGNSNWNLTTDYSVAIPECDVILVTVPTPVTMDLEPDLSFVYAAGESIFEHIKPGSGTIVVLESTVYPGVTRQSWIPLIESKGLKIAEDVHIAYCPERFNPGDPDNGVRSVARVIGCDNSEIGNQLVELYSQLTSGKVDYVGKIEVAEAAKIIENVQRDINIALVNELAQILPAMEVDVEDVLDAAATKWNFHRYTPGIGVGGHCIPVDPYYMIKRASEVGVTSNLISAARSVNRQMPEHVAKVIQDLFSDFPNPRVLFLGWSYKPEVGDPRETPADPLSRELAKSGCRVSVWDPYIEYVPDHVEMIDDIDTAEGYDMAVLITAHNICLEIDWVSLKDRMRTPIVFDGRRVLDLQELELMGWQTHAVGRP